MGLSRTEILDIPFEVLLTYIAIEQIKNENAEQKMTVIEEEEDFWRLVNFK